MDSFSRQADQEYQRHTSGLWPESLVPYMESLNSYTADALYHTPAQVTGSPLAYVVNPARSPQQWQIDTPNETCSTPQWSTSPATGMLDLSLNPGSPSQSVGSSMRVDLETYEQPMQVEMGIYEQPMLMDMEISDQPIESPTNSQEMASIEYLTQALNSTNWSSLITGFGASVQDRDRLPPYVQPGRFR